MTALEALSLADKGILTPVGDPDSDTIDPADDDQGDALVWHLWATARDQVALPTLDDSIDHSPSTEYR